MNSLRNSAFGLCALALLPFGAAHAQDCSACQINLQGPQINTNQIDTNHLTSTLNASVANVDGSLDIVGAAIGNTATIQTGQWQVVNNSQYAAAGIASSVNAAVSEVNGALTVTSAAIGNTASVDTGWNDGVVNNTQSTINVDPAASLNLSANNIYGDVSATVAAMGNSFSTLGASTVSSTQVNTAPIAAALTTSISNISGNVAITSAAIGNSLSVKLSN